VLTGCLLERLLCEYEVMVKEFVLLTPKLQDFCVEYSARGGSVPMCKKLCCEGLFVLEYAAAESPFYWNLVGLEL